MIDRYDASGYREAATQAERFVDDATWLRMTRLRMPLVKTELAGVTAETLRELHVSHARREDWNTPLTDIALRFEDGSLAYRLRESQRWEVYRSW